MSTNKRRLVGLAIFILTLPLYVTYYRHADLLGIQSQVQVEGISARFWWRSTKRFGAIYSSPWQLHLNAKGGKRGQAIDVLSAELHLPSGNTIFVVEEKNPVRADFRLYGYGGGARTVSSDIGEAIEFQVKQGQTVELVVIFRIDGLADGKVLQKRLTFVAEFKSGVAFYNIITDIT